SMKKSSILVLLAVLFIVSCSKDNAILDDGHTESKDPLTKEALDQIVLNKLNENQEFKWSMVDDHTLWSAIVRSGGITAIGYKAANTGDIKDIIHQIDINSTSWKKSKDEVMQIASSFEDKAEEDLYAMKPSTILPSVELKISSFELVKKLRSMDIIRYVEPMDYSFGEVEQRSGAGCGAGPASSIPSSDYTNISPSVKRPWNFNNNGVAGAWNTSKGNNITVAVIDTGVSPNQPKLGSQFSSGQSTGRSITKYGTYVDSWWPWADPDGPDDDCGHGTQMAGIVSAPRGYNGTAVGVAYQCDLMSIRGTDDVVINGNREKQGVRDALVLAANRSDVKVISMSLGDIFWSSTVADGVYYAYNSGKMVMAAAGTSTWFTSWVGVVFPARMNQTVAVTGIKDASTYQKCNTCHSGSKVDFVAVMQRYFDNNRTTLTLAMSGNQPAYVGGSSAATATLAGIAALVWANNPNQTRAQVLQKLKEASQFYPSRNSQYGWGLINAQEAVQ
ncbi:MAG: S8/S53 family peptidase, partial [Bacteroidota bacterium]